MSALLDGYIQLAHAIVIVAAESYKYTLLAVRHHTKSDSVYRRKEELESFSSLTEEEQHTKTLLSWWLDGQIALNDFYYFLHLYVCPYIQNSL